MGLFGKKKDIPMAHKADNVQANRAMYKGGERMYGERFAGECDHCKKKRHKKSQC